MYKYRKLLLLAALCTPIVFQQCKKKDHPTKPTSYNEQVATDSCGCEANWFPHSNTPPPAEGKGSPFDTSSTTNCMFHQWSWQKFLWLTKPSGTNSALFLDSLNLVDANMNPVAPQNGIKLILDDTLQAGSSGTLYTNPAANSNNKPYLVHYSIFVDNTLMNAARYYKGVIGANRQLLNNQYMFPIGSLELKVSWVDINAIPTDQQGSYFQTTAMIKTNTGYVQTTVAMLGMHVVGRVINHPEFIWATFEHDEMGPYYNWKNTTSTSDAPITSNKNMLLFQQGTTTGLYGITWNNKPDSAYRVYTLYKYGVPRTAGDAFLSGTSQSEPLNFDNIDGLNKCVKSGLGANDVWSNYFYNGSIWINTDGLDTTQQAQLIDSLQSNIGNVTTGSYARGSLNVFNLTMETWVQTYTPDLNNIHSLDTTNMINCFSCHSGSSSSIGGSGSTTYTSPLYVSHVFRNYFTQNANSTILDAKRNGVRDYIRILNIMKSKVKARQK